MRSPHEFPVAAPSRSAEGTALGWRGDERRLNTRARRGKGLSSADEHALSRRIARSAVEVSYDPETDIIRLTPRTGLRSNTLYTVWYHGVTAPRPDCSDEAPGLVPFSIQFRTGNAERAPDAEQPLTPFAQNTRAPASHPRLVATYPAPDAADVPVCAPIILEIDQPLDPMSVTDRTIGLRDVEAFRLFVEANLGLVHRAAGQYSRRGLPFDDLVQAGTIGLMRAVERFDPERGNRFSTFSVWWIQQAIQRAVGHLSPGIRVPDHAGEKLDRAARAEDALTQRLLRQPTRIDLAREIGETPELLTILRRAKRPPASLDSPASENSDTRLAELVPDPMADDPEDRAASALERQRLATALASLAPQQSRVLTLRYGFDDGVERTLSEVGGILGLSRERVRQIEAKALTLLRAGRRVKG